MKEKEKRNRNTQLNAIVDSEKKVSATINLKTNNTLITHSFVRCVCLKKCEKIQELLRLNFAEYEKLIKNNNKNV